MANVPATQREYPRPRARSWLDTTTRRTLDLLQERHGLTGYDPDSAYLVLADLIRERRDSIAENMGMSDREVQSYFTDESLKKIVDSMAVGVAVEKPGTDPFGDSETIPVVAEQWHHAILSLQLAALACQDINSTYAWSMVRIATSMVTALARTEPELVPYEDGEFLALHAPKAGLAFAARTLSAASGQIRSWGAGYDTLSATDLADGLADDSEQLGSYL